MAEFKKPSKAVPLKRRLKGLEEFDKPSWTPPRSRKPINWVTIWVVIFSVACFGLAYLLSRS